MSRRPDEVPPHNLSVRWRFAILRKSRPHGMAEPDSPKPTGPLGGVGQRLALESTWQTKRTSGQTSR